MLYMVTFTINIPPMLAYIPYMDPMGLPSSHDDPVDHFPIPQAWHGRGALGPARGPGDALPRHRGGGVRCLRAVDEGTGVTGGGPRGMENSMEKVRKMVISC